MAVREVQGSACICWLPVGCCVQTAVWVLLDKTVTLVISVIVALNCLVNLGDVHHHLYV